MLLIKHHLPSLGNEDWLRTADSLQWEPDTKQAVLQEFLDCILRSACFCETIVVTPEAWRRLGPATRLWLGTPVDLCAQRFTRHVLDRLEEAEFDDSITLSLTRKVGSLGRLIASVERIIKNDTRAKDRIASVQMLDFKRSAHLQACHLLRAIGTHQVDGQLKLVDVQENGADILSGIRGRLSVPSEFIFEVWDEAFLSQQCALLDWMRAGHASAHSFQLAEHAVLRG